MRRLSVVGAVAAVVVIADQITKTWAVHRLAHGPVHVVWKLDLQLEFNSGSAFSLAQGWAPILAAVTVVIVVLLLASVRRARSNLLAASIGLVVGARSGTSPIVSYARTTGPSWTSSRFISGPRSTSPTPP